MKKGKPCKKYTEEEQLERSRKDYAVIAGKTKFFTNVSVYCEECLKFKQKTCKGKNESKKAVTYFGTKIKKICMSGLNFCKLYEFDYRLYTFGDGSVETIQQVRERQTERYEETSDQEAFDDFDLGANLSSADLEI